MNADNYTLRPPPRMGRSALISIALALGSMFISCSGRPVWGLILAILAIPLALLGFIRAASPEIKGGPTSILAFILADLGVIIAVVGIVFKLPRIFF